ncbi:MAG: aspartate aminotransferase family protein [Anaerolineae bacterium]
MKVRDYGRLIAELEDMYTKRFPQAAALNEQGQAYLVDGGSHALRLMAPFAPRIRSAQGAWVRDEDGRNLLDFWQGHLAHVLGHNPEIVTSTLARTFAGGSGLQTGLPDRLQVEAAEILCRQTGAERARFTTSGTLATLYAILLARAFTGRDLVLKVGGGWHGAQPWGLKGVNYHAGGDGYQHMDTDGLPPALSDETLVTRFNDLDRLHDLFHRHGDRLACFIVEPVIGAKGSIPATPEYLYAARELTHRYGVVLILDEVITGFRFRAGNAGALYGVQPDLSTFGKIIGGGMPVAAVAGRTDMMALVGHEGGRRVAFSGGTYSAHPASLLAAKTLMTYLVDHEADIYPRLAALGEKTRRTLEAAFAQEGLYACCTGYGNEALPGSSIFMVHFPYDNSVKLESPEDVYDPAVCDVALTGKVLQLALLLEDVILVRGHGVVTVTHAEDDLYLFGEACRKVARRLKA